MPFNIGMPELIIILVVALLVFGAARLPQVGNALGKSIREFKRGMSGEGETKPETEPAKPAETTSAVTPPAADTASKKST